jgi:hypothetical protein
MMIFLIFSFQKSLGITRESMPNKDSQAFKFAQGNLRQEPEKVAETLIETSNTVIINYYSQFLKKDHVLNSINYIR